MDKAKRKKLEGELLQAANEILAGWDKSALPKVAADVKKNTRRIAKKFLKAVKSVAKKKEKATKKAAGTKPKPRTPPKKK